VNNPECWHFYLLPLGYPIFPNTRSPESLTLCIHQVTLSIHRLSYFYFLTPLFINSLLLQRIVDRVYYQVVVLQRSLQARGTACGLLIVDRNRVGSMIPCLTPTRILPRVDGDRIIQAMLTLIPDFELLS
jgi:hypothetical protein